MLIELKIEFISIDLLNILQLINNTKEILAVSPSVK